MQPQAILPDVLIVEDEVAIALSLAAIVEEIGYTVLLAYTGKQALQLLQDHHPLLILTDLMMPLMTGKELIHTLRAQAQPLPPIVIMSAASKNAMVDAGADAIMVKPFDITELERMLHRFLGKR